MRSEETKASATQLRRAATSVASNYRAACVARSHAEFRSTIATVLEEADEAKYWLEYLIRNRFLANAVSAELAGEAGQLTRIFAASSRTAWQTAAVEHKRRRSDRRHAQ